MTDSLDTKMTNHNPHRSEILDKGSTIRPDSHKDASEASSIFVTVGTDQHFNRMIKVIDQWAKEHNINNVFAQIGETDWKPQHIEYTSFLTPSEFVTRIQSADLIVGHAGMGTILTSLKFKKPVLVMPKRASLGEHRNEHQLATAKHLAALDKVNVALDEAELVAMLNDRTKINANSTVGSYASTSLTDAIASLIR